MFNQLGVIGCGLMGGSFALALKRAGLVKRVIGYSKSPSTTEKAKKLGVIDMAAESALLAVSGSDIVLIAVPVSWKSMLLGFILFRGFDIVKPPPLRQLEHLPEGIGIVLDDVGAGLYALALMQLALHFGLLP